MIAEGSVFQLFFSWIVSQITYYVELHIIFDFKGATPFVLSQKVGDSYD